MIITEKSHLDTDLWEGTASTYQRILELPFIRELAKGTLSVDRFARYLQQDALYLVEFARALSLIASKANFADDIISFIKFAEAAIVSEREIHDYYFAQYKIDCCVEKNSACFAYTHYLISTAATRSLEESVAAVLPCFWIYRDVGNYIYQHYEGNNPYERWILTYADEGFSRVVDEALSIAERMYKGASLRVQSEMKKLALQSSALEWQFWDVAYR